MLKTLSLILLVIFITICWFAATNYLYLEGLQEIKSGLFYRLWNITVNIVQILKYLKEQ
jgi:hypothetical protein